MIDLDKIKQEHLTSTYNRLITASAELRALEDNQIIRIQRIILIDEIENLKQETENLRQIVKIKDL